VSSLASERKARPFSRWYAILALDDRHYTITKLPVKPIKLFDLEKINGEDCGMIGSLVSVPKFCIKKTSTILLSPWVNYIKSALSQQSLSNCRKILITPALPVSSSEAAWKIISQRDLS